MTSPSGSSWVVPSPADGCVASDAAQAIEDVDDTDGLLAASIDHFVAHGWAVQDFVLPPALVLALATLCQTLSLEGVLRPAAVGRGPAQVLRPAIRGDEIQWLGVGQSAECDAYLAIMETMRQLLNRTLYLGLDRYESHFARYAPGAAYARHLDRFRDNDGRTVSVILYLNDQWQAADGGALRMHPKGEPLVDILPLGARLAMFLSADMIHEVLPATRERLSLAGWFSRRTP